MRSLLGLFVLLNDVRPPWRANNGYEPRLRTDWLQVIKKKAGCACGCENYTTLKLEMQRTSPY